jgi:hypothetical protein
MVEALAATAKDIYSQLTGFEDPAAISAFFDGQRVGPAN